MLKRLSSIRFNELIIHEVPKKDVFLGENGEDEYYPVKLSNGVIPIEGKLINFYRKKIVESLGSTRTFEIVFNAELENKSVQKKVEDSIKNIYENEKDKLIKETSSIARRLHDIQNGKNSAGILVFIPGKIGEERVYILLKVEKEDGLEIKTEEQQDGTVKFDITFLDNIMLTEKGKLFKATLFTMSEQGDLICYLNDPQANPRSATNVANFYLKDFLGANLKELPSVSTKKFYDRTIEFINDSQISDIYKMELTEAIHVSMRDNNVRFSPYDFARTNAHESYVADYIGHLRRTNAINEFEKNTEHIESYLKRTIIRTKKGFKLIGSQDLMTNVLSISETTIVGESLFSFVDKIEKVQK